ncbi:MAG TPA: lipoyl(octanoyl) transferase LipB [Polyangiales bacterium]|nr:lipoyl(octanoyl) transferase LipB [Polyangiales bacterium]
MARRALSVLKLGSCEYTRALELQETLREERLRGRRPDTLLLLEHEPVITLGRGAKPEHVLATRAELERQGIALHEIGRGGDVTYHGPGQLVGYPILDLKPDRCDVRRYVTDLEELMLRIAAAYGLTGRRIEGLRGIFVGDNKLGAVGVRISQWVTMHGFAINVSTDLDGFGLIVPCGIRDHGVTSLSRETGAPVEVSAVTELAVKLFCEIFDCELAPASTS